MTGKKTGPIDKAKKVDIKEQLKEIVETGQILGATDTQLALQLGISRPTLSKYLQEIYEAIPEEDIKEVRLKIDVMFKKLFREAQKLIRTAQTDKDKREAMEFLLKCIKEFTEFLERFGIKEKVPDKFEVEDKNVSELRKIWEETNAHNGR